MTRSSDVSVYTNGKTLAQKKASDLKARVRMVEQQENPLLLSIHQNHFPDSRYSGPQVFYPNTEGSEPLALTMQEALVTALAPGSKRMAGKSTGIYLMEHISCPALLVECGFLSHYGEETQLRDPEYQKKLAGVIGVTLSDYLSNT